MKTLDDGRQVWDLKIITDNVNTDSDVKEAAKALLALIDNQSFLLIDSREETQAPALFIDKPEYKEYLRNFLEGLVFFAGERIRVEGIMGE